MRAQTSQQRTPDEIEIRIARTLDEVESLRQSWTSWGGHRDSDIDVVLMIVDSLPEARRPHVIAVYRNGELDAILIGRLEEKRIAFRIGYLTGLQARARILTFVYGALRGNTSPENAEIFVTEIMGCLKNGEADVAFLELVSVDTPLYRKALSVPGFLGRDSYPASQLHDLMEVPDSMDKVYQRMSSNRRMKSRRQIKKLQTHPNGESHIVCFQETADLDLLFADAEQIAKKTYQRGLGAGFSDTPEVRARLALAARKGWLRAYLLYIGDRPVAFWVGMLYGGVFVSEYMGYDPEFRKFAPGIVLLLRVIEGFCSRPETDEVKILDFGPGHAEYKAILCTHNWSEAGVYIFSRTFKGLALKSLRTTTRLLDLSARKILASTGYFPRLKRWWRDHLAKQKPGSSQSEEPAPEVS